MFRVGLGYPVRLSPAAKLMFAVDAFHPSDNEESMSLGAEYQFRDFVALRVGYQDLFLSDSEVGVTAGGGIHGDLSESTYRIDYAWADHGRLGGTHRISVGFAF
jgi:long-subunit fatty acid transport protein